MRSRQTLMFDRMAKAVTLVRTKQQERLPPPPATTYNPSLQRQNALHNGVC